LRRGRGREALRGEHQSGPADGRGRGPDQRRGRARGGRDAALPPGGGDRGRRGAAPAPPLPRPAARGDAAPPGASPPRQPRDPRVAQRGGLLRDRDPDSHPVDPRGGPSPRPPATITSASSIDGPELSSCAWSIILADVEKSSSDGWTSSISARPPVSVGSKEPARNRARRGSDVQPTST